MRVTCMAEIKNSYIKARGGCGSELFIKSVVAMRNYL